MANLVRANPNYYSTQAPVTASSTDVVADAFGFNAKTLRFLNTEAVDFYVRTDSGGVASTADMRIRACSETVLQSMPMISGFTAYTTSTSAAAKLLGLTALGD